MYSFVQGATISGVIMQKYNKIPFLLVKYLLLVLQSPTLFYPNHTRNPLTQTKKLLRSFHSSNKQNDLSKTRLCLLRLLSGSSSSGSGSLLSLGLGLSLSLLRLHRTTPLTSLSLTYDCFRISRISASSTFFSEGYAARSMVSPLMRLVPLSVSSTVNL